MCVFIGEDFMSGLGFHLEQAKVQRQISTKEQQTMADLGRQIRAERQRRFDEVMAKNEMTRQKYEYLQRIHFCDNQILHALHRLSLIKEEFDHLHTTLNTLKQQLTQESSNQPELLNQIVLCQQEEQSLLVEQEALNSDIKDNQTILEQSKQRLKATESAIQLSERTLAQYDQTIAQLDNKRQRCHQNMKAALLLAEHHEQSAKTLKQQETSVQNNNNGIEVVSKHASPSHLSADDLRTQIRFHDQQAKDANEKMQNALTEKDHATAGEWRETRDRHNQQSRDLSQTLKALNEKAQTSTSHSNNNKVNKELNRSEIKDHIRHHNQQAVIAHGHMQAALTHGRHDEAQTWRLTRDQHNQTSAQYQTLLQQTTSTTKQSKIDAEDCRIENLAAEFAADLQKYASMVDYAQDPTHDHLIRCLLSVKSYGFSDNYVSAMLNNVNGQRYNIHQQSDVDQLQQRLAQDKQGRFVVEPFIRDAFKLTLPIEETTPLNFDHFDISDRIAMSDFRSDFDAKVHSLNRYIKNQLNNPNSVHLKTFDQVAHRDAIQIIPKPTAQFKWRDHFLGIAIKRPINISNNRIQSSLSLQGIFASDGAFKQLSVCDNQVDIKGGHTISIAGVLAGKFEGNCDLDQQPLANDKIKLLPIRLGGGSNIFITGFHPDSEYDYQKAHIPPECDFRDHPSPFNKRGHASFYTNVHMERFHEQYLQLLHSPTTLNKLDQQKQAVDQGEHAGIRNMPPMYYYIKFVLNDLLQQGLAEEDHRPAHVT